jgi:hypothetical protein
MAVYTTFFAATASELEAAFPGWKKPLPAPVKRTTINPFTRTPQTYDSWEPDEVLIQPSAAPSTPPAPRVVAMQGDYQSYLRQRLPAGLHGLPLFPAKGVLSPHVEQLLAAVAGRAEEHLKPALFPLGGSRATGKTLDVLPAWGAEALAGLDHTASSGIGDRLATAEGWFADDGWGAADCARLIGDLRDIALKARETRRSVYLLTEA